ncbi:superoxide dismutase family protein [Inhella proteolytica]|uniref:Superoxide dismutase [Cu-Zn] n=1 Tax=Inhella proteolytica TaxID=2795029 RepID=A0A931J4P3_9BURK|nr:superoxide dismutase family protein [Inhella proteolytica]MBH9578678.1 superoxide dismutase family protein [Inhella proteolytica]
MRTLKMWPSGLITCVALTACAWPGGNPKINASAGIKPASGSSVAGDVRFFEGSGGVFVHARISGLTPGAEHGFHIHEKGDCSKPDGSSAGGHFNPEGHAHGPQAAEHHAGDMPALKADASGVAEAKFFLKGVSVGAKNDITGRGLIVHAQPDDYKTQPTGNSGARIGCGVIAAAK